MADVKNNLRAVAAPQVTDDTTQGYIIGSEWHLNGQVWECADASAGAAAWYIQAPAIDNWKSGQRRYADNVSVGTNGAISTTTDLMTLTPIKVDATVMVDTILAYVAATTGGSALMDVALYDTIPATGLPRNRLGRAQGLDMATATGTKFGSFTSVKIGPGVYWLCAGIKGVATPMNVAKISSSNGKHFPKADMSEGGVLCKYLSAPYTYATTLPASLASGYTFTRSNGEDGVLLALRRA